jgi:hypothetical protein
MMPKPGIYKHFKGNYYRVVGLARHTETNEDLVMYYDVNNPDKTWVRPLLSFVELVLHDGATVPRFKLMS